MTYQVVKVSNIYFLLATRHPRTNSVSIPEYTDAQKYYYSRLFPVLSSLSKGFKNIKLPDAARRLS